jgi:hypothetical protein
MVLAIYLTLYNNAVRPVKRKGWHITHMTSSFHSVQGRIQDLKKIAPSVGRRENFGGISCEKSRFYAKKNHFFPILGGGGGGAHTGCAPLDPPLQLNPTTFFLLNACIKPEKER